MSVRDTGEVFVAAPTSKPTMRFTGGTPLAKVEAALLNFLGPLIADQALPSVVSSVTSGVNASAMAAVASVMLPGPNPMARSGVTVCAQAVILRADDTNSFAVAVGNFGKIFPDPHQDGGGGSSCALSAALAVLPTLRLDLFRAFRDNVLARSRIGRDCIALYYAHSAEIRDLVLLSPRLMAKTAELVREMERDLASGGSLSAKAVQKLGSFLNGLAANGSASLRRDLSELSSRMAWVVQGPGVLGGLGSV
jgi:hypothetical protein